MKTLAMLIAVAMMGCMAFVSTARAADTKTVSGKSACATCEGVTKAGHNIMLIDSDGMRWVLDGDSASYKAAHDVRKEGKQMTATLAGEVATKKDSDGKEYKEVKVSDVKIDA